MKEGGRREEEGEWKREGGRMRKEGSRKLEVGERRDEVWRRGRKEIGMEEGSMKMMEEEEMVGSFQFFLGFLFFYELIL